MSQTRFSPQEIITRQNLIKQVFVDYSQTLAARAELEECLLRGIMGNGSPAASVEAEDELPCAQLSLLIATSGCGKTTLIHKFIAEKRLDASVLPGAILRVSLPTQCTIKQMTEEILAKLGDGLSGRTSTAANNTRRIVDALRRKGVKLLIIDEFQHLYDRDRRKVIHATTDWLKKLLDDAGVEVVCVGMEDSITIVESNIQLERRTASRIEMRPLRWDAKDDSMEFRIQLKAFEEAIQAGCASGLHQPKLAHLIHLATGGVIGKVVQLLRQAVKASMSRAEGDDRITTQDLEMGFRNLAPTRKNPFSVTQRAAIEADNKVVTTARPGKRPDHGQPGTQA